MNKVHEIIKNAGLKVTVNRAVIYKLMQELKHSSIEEVIAELQKLYPDISISTVYRILDSFCEANLLMPIYHPNGKVYYDIVAQEHHHIFHPDNSIEDYEDEELTALIKNRLQSKMLPHEEIERVSIKIVTKKK